MQCGAFDIITFDKIAGTDGLVTVGSMKAQGARLQNYTLVPLAYSETEVNMTASQFVDTYWVVGDLASGSTTYNIPTADEILAAFVAAGKPLAVGDTFTIPVFSGAITNSAIFHMQAGDTPCVMASGTSGTNTTPNHVLVLRFEVTGVTTPAIRIFILYG